MRGLSCRVAIVTLAAVAVAPVSFASDAKTHRIAIQVDQNDPQVMNLALNNATNIIDYYRAKNEDVEIDVVIYGPGLEMLRADSSPVRERIKHLRETAPPGKLVFSVCNNTRWAWRKRKATRSSFYRTRRWCPRASCIDGLAGARLELRPAVDHDAIK